MLQSIWIGCYISLVESRSMILAMIKGSGCYWCNCLLFYIQFMRGQLYSNRPRSITRGFIKWCRNLHHCYKMIGMRLTLSLDSWIQLWRCSVICDAFHPDKFDSGALLRLKHIIVIYILWKIWYISVFALQVGVSCCLWRMLPNNSTCIRKMK